MAPVVEEKDVVIIGAGISGIDSAYRIQTETDLSFTVLESRHEIGGTWSLFQFPGIRSDSDMFTLGFPFRPWTSKRAIADGADILQYVKDTAAEFGIDKKIQFQSKVSEASWSSKEARWTLKVSSPKNEIREVKARFVMFASGYYDYDEGFYPTLPGAKNFEGPIVQPQWWPKGLQYQGKRVIVIGSGATAVTIVPNMAQQGAAHVTMLQRSPSYILSVPGENKLANKIRSIFPKQVAHTCLRVINTLGAGLLTSTSHWFPNYVRKLVMGQARKQLPPGYEVEKHFNPSYNPWDQRMCLVPDGDFYEKIREGKVSVATGHIQEITRNAIKLQDGQELQADIIVQATGLKLKMFGGALITIDGDKFNVNEHYCYRGQMIEGIPNASMSFVRTYNVHANMLLIRFSGLCRCIVDSRCRSMCKIHDAASKLYEKEWLQHCYSSSRQ